MVNMMSKADQYKGFGFPKNRDNDVIENTFPQARIRLPGQTALARLACRATQPLLTRVVRRIASGHPSLFARLGDYQKADFVIDPIEFPFALHLRPDPDDLAFRAVTRPVELQPVAVIRGRFLLLLELIDAEQDGDAAFFSRELEITGDTEAVVRLRNALDDVDGSIAQDTAEMFGPPGRAVLARLRRYYLDSTKGQ